MAGVPAAGKSESVDRLLEWLDARGVETHALRDPTDEESERPAMYRYWRALPPHGRIGIFFGGWDGGAFLSRVCGKITQGELDRALDRYVAFERMLMQENILLVKVWLHLSEQAMKRRLSKLRRDPAHALARHAGGPETAPTGTTSLLSARRAPAPPHRYGEVALDNPRGDRPPLPRLHVGRTLLTASPSRLERDEGGRRRRAGAACC